jgi:hypothetical protein
MYGCPFGFLASCGPTMPIPAGTWLCFPFAKTVRAACQWKSRRKFDWQLMPSTSWPAAVVAVPARGAVLGTGTPS